MLSSCFLTILRSSLYIIVLPAMIQSLKESVVVAMESFSIELIEVIVHKCSEKGVFEILEELMKKHPQQNKTSDNRVYMHAGIKTTKKVRKLCI